MDDFRGMTSSLLQDGADFLRTYSTIIFGMLAVVYAAVRVYFFLDQPLVHSHADSQGYLLVADLPLASKTFFMNFRAFVYPLVLKMLFKQSVLIVCFQLLTSVFAWLSLSYFIYTSVESILLKLPTAVFCLLISLSPNISQWDNFILTESLMISVLIIWVLCFIVLFQRGSWPSVGLFVLVSFLLANLKLLNIYLILFSAISLFLIYIFQRENKLLITSLCLFLIFSLSHFVANQGNRDLIPLMNNIQARIIPYEHRLQWFDREGMPVNQDVLGTSGKMAWDLNFKNNQELKGYRRWVLNEGRSTYIKFILTHPRYSIAGPMSDIVEVSWYDDLLLYGEIQEQLKLYGGYIHRLFYRWAFLLLVLTMGAYSYSNGHGSPRFDPSILLFIVAVGTYIIGWLGDPAEITRHVLSASILMRISCLLGFVALANGRPIHGSRCS